MDSKTDTTEAQAGKHRRAPIGMFAMVAAEIWANPKIVAAGPHGALVFIFLLTRNAQRGRKGFFPAADAAPSYIARQLGLEAREAADALQACVDAELVELNEDNLYVLGWDETWARKALTETEARMLRKRKSKIERETKNEKAKSKIQKERESEKQKQNKTSPDKARTQSGPVGVALNPPMTELENQQARRVIECLHGYTGVTAVVRPEVEQVVRLLRGEGGVRVAVEHLEALAIYTADSGGLGWLNKEDGEGAFHMRRHLTVSYVFSHKHIQKYLTTAISPGAWEPEESEWRHPVPRAASL